MRKLFIIISFLSLGFDVFTQPPEVEWKVKMLPINTNANEYLPFVVNNILFFTATGKNPRSTYADTSENVFFSIFVDTSYSKIKRFSYKANTDANTALIGISDSCFYFYRSYFEDNGEIYKGPKKEEERIKPIKKVPYILSNKDENSISIYGDSTYLTSNRNSSYDIFVQTGKGKPTPIDILNSSFDEKGVWVDSSGKKLYFNSNREGNFDIYKSDFVNGKWQVPEKLPYPINTEYDDIDYRQYDDSTCYLASNRPDSLGGYNIYKGIKPKMPTTKDSVLVEEPKDSIPIRDTTNIAVLVKDSIPMITRSIIPTNQIDSLSAREQLLIELKQLDLLPFRGEIQVGAYKKYLTSIDKFKNWFKCSQQENIRMDVFEIIGSKPLLKFVIDHLYTDLDSAINKQIDLINLGCFPTTFEGTPFIALLRADGERFAIFWKKEEYTGKDVLWIKQGQIEVWHSK